MCEMKTFGTPAGLFVLVLMATAVPVAARADTPDPADQKIARRIEQHGDDQYFVRRQAQDELTKFSFEAFDAVSAATTHKDPEIAARANYLVRLMRIEWTTADDPPEVKKLLDGYEVLSTSNKLARMRALAKLPGTSGTAALCRLIRYEKSHVLSKRAALLLLGPDPPEEELAGAIRKNLADSRRTAVGWLKLYLRSADDLEAATADWAEMVAAEHAALQQSPYRTDTYIVAELVRLQIEWLKRTSQNDKAVSAMQKLIALETGDPKRLLKLLDWLVEEKAYSVADKLESKFAKVFAGNPLLLYTMADVRLAQGKKTEAEETADRAIKLIPGKQSDALLKHLQVAFRLQRRGQFAWAKREYEHVIHADAKESELAMTARSWLAEMLHDQGDDLQAAEVLEKLIADAAANAKNGKAGRITLKSPRTMDETRARMNFFHACHFQNKGEPAKQREHLDKALEAGPYDVDVMIACYRLPDQTPEYREKVLLLIKELAQRTRKEISKNPDDPTPHNQLAWLIGNTEGDFDEALRYSNRSLQLLPKSGGYLDTLAHVYFGKGDYENAVKFQTMAAELEPHSGLIARKLKVFKKKLQETK